MKANHSVNLIPSEGDNIRRREFLRNGVSLGLLTGVAGLGLLAGCGKEEAEGIAPAEDLMREHGVLNRIMLIYDACRMHLVNGEEFSTGALNNAAGIIRTFIEDYHEKLEEDYLFPRFEKANVLIDLIRVLRDQHKAGRILTDQIIQLTKTSVIELKDDSQKLIRLLGDFNSMYRPHEAREDTQLFPSIRKVVTGNEYFALGEDFEDKEHELFGESGFEGIVEKVGTLEKQLGIFELSKFTPTL
jgi:hemerythrin-like domain-containing protein